MMALDQSGSMNDPAGSSGMRRIDALRYAAKVFVDVIQPGNAVGLIRFDDPAYAVNDANYPGRAITAIGEGILDLGRSRVRDSINLHATNPAGWTSIGAGIVEARSVVSGATGYDVRAVLVFTDGKQNRDPLIENVVSDSDTRIYAVGLGDVNQINAAELAAITRGANGFTNITGELGTSDDDFYKLTKYFLQILAGVTNTAIVRDPAGFLPLGAKVRIPFKVANVDIESTVVLLTDLPAVDFTLETPAGNVITPSNATARGARFYDASTTQYYRFALPVTSGTAQESTGTWHAVLRVNRDRFRKYCHQDDPKVSGSATGESQAVVAAAGERPPALTPCSRGGIRYNVSMYAWSNLRLKAAVYQNSLAPGATLTIRALIDEYGIPFDGGAHVYAKLKAPDGVETKPVLEKVAEGVWEAEVVAKVPGLYEILVVAGGSTSKGFGFTREQVLTAWVIVGGDRPGTGGGGPVSGGQGGAGCCLVKSLLKNREVGAFLKKHDVDAAKLVKSVEECCRPKVTGPPR
jgi:hypothetical protein